MNSFIAWIGGKKLLRKEIVKRFPEEGFTRYVEVFGGAGWVLFEKEQGKELEVFNDRDSNLINLYRCIKYHCGELQRELEWLTISAGTVLWTARASLTVRDLRISRERRGSFIL